MNCRRREITDFYSICSICLFRIWPGVALGRFRGVVCAVWVLWLSRGESSIYLAIKYAS